MIASIVGDPENPTGMFMPEEIDSWAEEWLRIAQERAGGAEDDHGQGKPPATPHRGCQSEKQAVPSRLPGAGSNG